MARSITSTAAASSSRNKGVLMLALLFGILSAALMFAFLSSKGGGKDLSEQLGAGEGAESVVVVVRDIAAGEKIERGALEMRTIPANGLLQGRFTTQDDVEGKVATAPIFAGEQVIEAKLTSYATADEIAYKIPQDMRALSLMVPHEAWIAAGLPQPGDRVDILGITTLIKIDPLTGQEKPDIIAGLMAQDVEVLAVSQRLVRKVVGVESLPGASTTPAAGTEAGTNPDPAVSTATEDEGDGETFETSISITLALAPDLAAKIAIIDAMDDSQGQYRILPRQKGDTKSIDGQQTWSLDEVFNTKK
ncbi:MAG: Flp pilus assembly protein CpaB [Dehalococcoidia bacterium]|nr:Flp pilus assembly protein CpaB [Dehalococcoidia bacterium]